MGVFSENALKIQKREKCSTPPRRPPQPQILDRTVLSSLSPLCTLSCEHQRPRHLRRCHALFCSLSRKHQPSTASPSLSLPLSSLLSLSQASTVDRLAIDVDAALLSVLSLASIDHRPRPPSLKPPSTSPATAEAAIDLARHR